MPPRLTRPLPIAMLDGDMSTPEASAEAPEIPMASPEAAVDAASESTRRIEDSDSGPAAEQPVGGAQPAELPGEPSEALGGLDASEATEAATEADPAPGAPPGDAWDEQLEPEAHGEDLSEVPTTEVPPDATEEGLEAELGVSGDIDAQLTADGDTPEVEEDLPPLTEEARAALGQALFALLFASPDPLSLGRLKDLTESPTAHVRDGLVAVEELVEASGLPLVLKAIAGGYRLFSAPEVAEVVARLAKVRKAEQVTPAALETLSIVAYRQPTTKAEVEAIRGVQAGPMLRQLIDRGLVKVAGRADQPGSPLLYATTKDFLDRFGLAKLKDLPRDAELK